MYCPERRSKSDTAYRGSRTTPSASGTWMPFDPSLDMIALELALGADYFTGSKYAEIGDDCTDPDNGRDGGYVEIVFQKQAQGNRVVHL